MSAPIIWRDVAAPNLDTSVSALRLAQEGWNSGFNALNRGIDSWDASRHQDASNQFARNAAQFGSQADLMGALKDKNSGLYNNIDQNLIGASDITNATNRASGLLTQATNQEAYNQTLKTNPIKLADAQEASRWGKYTHERQEASDQENDDSDEKAAAIAKGAQSVDDLVRNASGDEELMKDSSLFNKTMTKAKSMLGNLQGGGGGTGDAGAVAGAPGSAVGADAGSPTSRVNGALAAVGSSPAAGAGAFYSPGAAAALAKSVGATDAEARTLGALVHPESSGNPMNHNDNYLRGGRDDSYGLWQVNMLGKMGEDRLKQFGIKSKEDLYDPTVNAKAALAILRSQGPTAWSTYNGDGYKGALASADPYSKDNPNIQGLLTSQKTREADLLRDMQSRSSQESASGINGQFDDAMNDTKTDRATVITDLANGYMKGVSRQKIAEAVDRLQAKSIGEGTGKRQVTYKAAGEIIKSAYAPNDGDWNWYRPWTYDRAWNPDMVQTDGGKKEQEILEQAGRGMTDQVIRQNQERAAVASTLAQAQAERARDEAAFNAAQKAVAMGRKDVAAVLPQRAQALQTSMSKVDRILAAQTQPMGESPDKDAPFGYAPDGKTPIPDMGRAPLRAYKNEGKGKKEASKSAEILATAGAAPAEPEAPYVNPNAGQIGWQLHAANNRNVGRVGWQF